MVQHIEMPFALTTERMLDACIPSRSWASCYVKLLTDRDKQTDRQTNAGHYITSLAEVIDVILTNNTEMIPVEHAK